MKNNKHPYAYIFAVLAVLFLPLETVHAEQGDWLVRLRGIAVAPNDDSSAVSLNGTALPGTTGVEVDTRGTPELDITYMFHRHWGVELIAATAEHNVDFQGTTTLPSGTKLFDTWVLPPTLLLQYHFLPDAKFHPYVGAGVNYTTFIDENASNHLEGLLGPVDVKMDNSWGWALQAGMDIDIRDNWFLNFDIKYIDIDSTAKLDTALGRLSVDVDIDPWVAGAGIGYRF